MLNELFEQIPRREASHRRGPGLRLGQPGQGAEGGRWASAGGRTKVGPQVSGEDREQQGPAEGHHAAVLPAKPCDGSFRPENGGELCHTGLR